MSMGMENAIVPNYPVEMKWTDFVLTSMLVIFITWIISFRPASLAAKSYAVDQL